MANWGQALNIAGGASRGILEGQEDLRRKAEFDYLQQKRKADLEQMAIEKAAEAKASGVLPEGEYPYEDRSQMGLNEVGPSPKTQMVKRTAGDVEKEQIAALRGGTATQRSQAIQMQTAAQQRQQFDFQMHQQRVTQLGMTASIMAHQNPEAAMQLIAQNYNEHVHDGQQMIVQRGANGQPVYGYAVGGKLTGPLQPITPEIALQHAGMVMQYASPQMWDAMEKAKTAARNAGAAERTAGAHETVARTGENKAEWETTGPGGQAEITLKGKQGEHWDAYADWMRSRSTAEKETPSQAAMKKIEEYSTILQRANPKLSKEDADKQAASIIMRDPNAKNPAQGMIEQGYINPSGNQWLERNKKGKWVPVQLPGQGTSLAEQFIKAEGGGPPAAAAPAQGIVPSTAAPPAATPPAPTRPTPTVDVTGAAYNPQRATKPIAASQRNRGYEAPKYPVTMPTAADYAAAQGIAPPVTAAPTAAPGPVAAPAPVPKGRAAPKDQFKILQDELTAELAAPNPNPQNIAALRAEMKRYFPKGPPG